MAGFWRQQRSKRSCGDNLQGKSVPKVKEGLAPGALTLLSLYVITSVGIVRASPGTSDTEEEVITVTASLLVATDASTAQCAAPSVSLSRRMNQAHETEVSTRKHISIHYY